MLYCCESWSWQICQQIYPSPPNASWDIYYGMYLAAMLDSSWKGGISFYFWIIRVVNSQLALYSHVRCNPRWYPNTPETPSKHPQVPEERWLAYDYTKLGRWTYVGQWTPHTRGEITSIPLHKTWQMNLHWLMDPSSTRGEMTCIPLHKTWQINLHWLMDPPLTEERWLAYDYTKLGRWTYIGQWTPQYQWRDDLHMTTQNLADEPTLANGPPSTRGEMTCIRLHKTWQMNLHWPMDLPSTRGEMTCIPLHKTWQMNLHWPMDLPSTRGEMTCIPLHKTWQMNLLWLNTMAKVWKL